MTAPTGPALSAAERTRLTRVAYETWREAPVGSDAFALVVDAIFANRRTDTRPPSPLPNAGEADAFASLRVELTLHDQLDAALDTIARLTRELEKRNGGPNS